MNKTVIKNFAVWARRKLISDITNKAKMLGVDENGIAEKLPQSTDDLHFFDVGTKTYAEVAGNEIIQREALVKAIKAKEHSFKNYKEAFENVVEETAYTWFNRLVAIRFMEVNDYLPSGVRVLSSINKAKNEPDFVTTPFDTDLEFTPYEQDRVIQLKDENKLDELFRMLFIKQCNKLHDILPELFEKTDDYTELLLTISFTDKDGIVYRLVHDIEEDDFNVEKEGQVEIIGWMYQYYNTELNEQVYDGSFSKSKIPKELIPAATTIYTPDWAIRYMVENSLGRIVIHNLKYADWSESEKTKINDFKSKWKYYLEEAEQNPEIVERFSIEESHKYCKGDLPPFVDTTFLDPCMGSGHILVYAFDVFMDIYRMQGYTDREAVRSILENNLYGLELDDRATQLAYFSIMMKARSYDRRFLTRKGENGKPDIPKLNICSIQESNSINAEYIELFGELKPIAQKLLDEFIDAKEYGSILNLSITEEEILQLEEKYAEIDNTVYDNFFDAISQDGLRTGFAPILNQSKVLNKQFDVICTNPPYLGGNRFSPKLSDYIKKHYDFAKTDLSMVMYWKSLEGFSHNNSYIAFITTSSWLTLSRFERLREKIYKEYSIQSLVDFGTELFDGKVGHNPIVSWITKKAQMDYRFLSIKLSDYCYSRKNEKIIQFFNKDNYYLNYQKSFSRMPEYVISYSASEAVYRAYDEGTLLSEIAQPKQGMVTRDNNRFIRSWWEPSLVKIGFNVFSHEICRVSNCKWYPSTTGGEYRKWFGNNVDVINYYHDGLEIIGFSGSHIKNREFYFLENLTWSAISSASLSMRYTPAGFLAEHAGNCLYCDYDSLSIIQAICNGAVGKHILSILSPTLNFNVGHIANIPILRIDETNKHIVLEIVEQLRREAKNDWDSYETSWDFQTHPFVRWSKGLWDCTCIAASMDYFYGGHPKVSCPIELCFMLWQGECNERFNQLKANEEELNRIFIDIYGLQDELTPEVDDKDVTVRKADLQRDIKSFISYAVGCMFGRYSLDKEGLVFAGGNFNDTFIEDALYPSDTLYPSDNLFPKEPEYTKLKTDDGEIDLSFYPDYDNCIPITDEAYFEDDIVGRFEEFVKVVYGEQTLEENLDFIAKALGNKGVTSRDVIRNYFLNDFFKDHCKTYQKRPIYWLFDSGKQNGFKALCYMHRWNADTIGNMRVEYLHRIQRVYEKELERMQEIIDNSRDNKEISNATKRKEKLQKQIKETKDYDAKVAHLALSRIDIDLDDGVKVNYEKVQTGQDGKKLQILAKI